MFSIVLKKHQRQLALTAMQALNNTSSKALNAPLRYFSAAPVADEAAKAKEEWGEKYSDECFQFEKEWKTISEKIEGEQRVYIESELGELQKKKVEMLADKLLDMNLFELRYFALLSKEKI